MKETAIAFAVGSLLAAGDPGGALATLVASPFFPLVGVVGLAALTWHSERWRIG